MKVELVWFFGTCAGMQSLHEVKVGLKLLLVSYVATFEMDLVDSSQWYQKSTLASVVWDLFSLNSNTQYTIRIHNN